MARASRDRGVRQSFGNCPKYIQARHAQWVGDTDASSTRVVKAGALDAAGEALVRGADTYFIASSVPPSQLDRDAAHGVDVSHRGGKPGFVRVERDADGVHSLTVPDFSGNNMFNTLGNLSVYPRAGLLFGRFHRTQPDATVGGHRDRLGWARRGGASPGRSVLRHWRARCWRIEGAQALRWGPAHSPFLQATGGGWAAA